MLLLVLGFILPFVFAFIILLGGQEAGGGFAGFVVAVLVDFGLGGFSGAAGFFAAGGR